MYGGGRWGGEDDLTGWISRATSRSIGSVHAHGSLNSRHARRLSRNVINRPLPTGTTDILYKPRSVGLDQLSSESPLAAARTDGSGT
jgi:hypothetical protein